MIDKTFLRVAKILTFAGDRPLTNATGFFYQHDGFLYLVTSRHVVIDEATQHRPDQLQVSLHTDATDLRKRSDMSIPLYLDGIPQWWQHSKLGCNGDVVAVAVNDPHVLSSHLVDTFCRDDILNMDDDLPLGQDVLILGFPLGFHDTVHNLPIVRSATIASSFSHPFKGEPYFLTDARLHRGMSGSPVIVRTRRRLEFADNRQTGLRLLGVHSSALDVSDRDPNQDERLGLNMTWYASLIAEMLPSRSPLERRAASKS
jgi:hypothetical protein